LSNLTASGGVREIEVALLTEADLASAIERYFASDLHANPKHPASGDNGCDSAAFLGRGGHITMGAYAGLVRTRPAEALPDCDASAASLDVKASS